MLKKIFFLVIFVSLSIAFFYGQKLSLNQKNQNFLEPAKMQSKKTIKDAKIVGWTAYWDEQNTFNSLTNVIQYLNTFSPILYRIEPDGSLGRLNVIFRKNFLDLARQHNLPIIPVIGDDFDFERVSLLLYNHQIQEKFIKSLVDEAQKEGFGGWSIDIESLKKEDKEAFTNFIVKSANSLQQNGLKLNVIVFARTGNDNNPASLAQDYKSLGAAANEVQLMMYGASDEETEPGGQAPLSFVREVLSYTIKLVPKEKVVVGLSTHGYDWGGNSAEPLTFPQIEKRTKEASASVSFDPKVSSAIARYQKNGVDHQIWFEDEVAITQKMELILNQFDINKFALWRIGAEDSEIWNKLQELK